MGRRAYKKVTVNGEVTLHQRYIYRDYLQIAALDLTRSHHPCLWLLTWDPSQPVATRPLAIQKDGTWRTYGLDLTKNVSEVFGSNGYINTSYNYTPFGSVSASGSVSQPIQWSSEFHDLELGMIYYNWRYYNTILSRWNSFDKIEKLDYNKYGYCGNNMQHFDILGLSSIVLLYDSTDSMFKEWAEKVKNKIQNHDKTYYGAYIKYSPGSDKIYMIKSNPNMHEELKGIKDISYFGTFAHGSSGRIYWSTGNGQVVTGIPGFTIQNQANAQRYEISEFFDLDFAYYSTIEIYHCYAGLFLACDKNGKLITNNHKTRAPRTGEIRKSVQSEIYLFLTEKGLRTRIFASKAGISNGYLFNRGWPRFTQYFKGGISKKINY